MNSNRPNKSVDSTSGSGLFDFESMILGRFRSRVTYCVLRKNRVDGPFEGFTFNLFVVGVSFALHDEESAVAQCRNSGGSRGQYIGQLAHDFTIAQMSYFFTPFLGLSNKRRRTRHWRGTGNSGRVCFWFGHLVCWLRFGAVQAAGPSAFALCRVGFHPALMTFPRSAAAFFSSIVSVVSVS